MHASTIGKNQTMIQVYDKIHERQYIKILGGAIISHNEVLRTDILESEVTLAIATEKMPNKILINGKEIKFSVCDF